MTSDRDAFVSVDSAGHFSINGKRIRFWSTTGGFTLLKTPDRRPYADMDLMVERLAELGFNMVRYPNQGGLEYRKGDRSEADIGDYFFFRMKEAGFKIWSTSLSKGAGKAFADDVGIIDDPKTADAWKAAIADWIGPERKTLRLTNNVARIWDPRLEAIALRGMKRMASRVNQYTGMSSADDPLFALWELSNEDGFISRMTGGEWQEIPRFFQDQLLTKWHGFLERKYESEDRLRRAWGFLLSGESMKDRSILLAPIRSSTLPVVISDANPHAVAMLQSRKQPYSRADFTRQRGSDVLEFFTDLWIAHKRREAEAVKPLGKSLSQCALLWNTGFPGSSIQCQYLHQHADAVAHDSYIGGTHHDPTHRRFPFFSGLEELPRLAWNEPWLEHNRTPGKPYIVYETQIDNTGKYRAEFPMRIASLGAIQDWDIICWHYYGFAPDSKRDTPFVDKLDVGHSLNLHFQFDEVQLAAMKTAGEIFKSGALEPSPNPTLFVFGKKALYDPTGMDPEQSYGPGMLDRMAATTYRYGMRLIIDPSLEEKPDAPVFSNESEFKTFLERGYLIKGPSYRPRTFEPNPIRPNDQIEYDWQRGHLKFDAPGVAGYAGFLAQYGEDISFRNGTSIGDVRIINPSGMPYPVGEEEKFIVFSLVSADGKALGESRRMFVGLVSTSFNTGFRLHTERMVEFFAPACELGTLPVLVARVGATVTNHRLSGMKYRFIDWNRNLIGEGRVEDGTLRIPARLPVFYTELIAE